MVDRALNPVWKSPLDGVAPASHTSSSATATRIEIKECADHGYITLRGKPSNLEFLAATARILGGDLPLAPCSVVCHGDIEVLWLSPDEWLLVTARTNITALTTQLSDALKGIHAQVVDNSGGYTQVEISGTATRDVLSHCTVYDLDQLREGRVVGTTFGKVTAYLRRDGDRTVVLLRRSFADYIWLILVGAAKPYGSGFTDAGAQTPHRQPLS